MLDKKMPMKVGAKTPWSRATRARMVRLAVRRLTFFCRNLNQVAAAGPKITDGVLAWGVEGEMGDGGLTAAVEGHATCSG